MKLFFSKARPLFICDFKEKSNKYDRLPLICSPLCDSYIHHERKGHEFYGHNNFFSLIDLRFERKKGKKLKPFFHFFVATQFNSFLEPITSESLISIVRFVEKKMDAHNGKDFSVVIIKTKEANLFNSFFYLLGTWKIIYWAIILLIIWFKGILCPFCASSVERKNRVASVHRTVCAVNVINWWAQKKKKICFVKK